MHLHRPELDARYLPLSLSLLISEVASLTDSEAHHPGKANQPETWDLPFSVPCARITLLH